MDPPLHEFLPKCENLIVDYAKLEFVDAKAKKRMAAESCEVKTCPELSEILPEVMIPLIGSVKELEHQRKIVVDVGTAVLAKACRT